jgi:S-adenosylmethionine:tRNA ribosyltransferase-isomerase
MQISEFDYKLPEALIAQNPLEKREISQMLTVNLSDETIKDEQFFNFPKFLKKGDIIVLNNTKVFPARLFGTSETGGKFELFLVEEIGNKIWETLARPAKRLKIGKKIVFNEDLSAEVLEKTLEGRVVVKFNCSKNFDEIIDKIGQTPLPPYIKRDDDFTLDKDR